ncbi:hypothetical protein EON65_14245 [archaeon]|nr:MAG: hypothetical protein EON65_14245 [archaeon]
MMPYTYVGFSPYSKFGKRDLPGLDKDRNDVDMKERIAAVIGTYQHSLQLTENKLAHAMQENMELKVKVKQLLSSNPASMSKISRHDTESHTAKPEAVTDFQYKQAIDQQTSQLTQQYKVMYENLSKEIFALKNELVTTKQREQSLQQALSRGQSQNVSRVPSAVGEPGQRLDAVLGKDAAVTSSRAQDIIADVLEKKHSVPMLTLPSVWNDAVGSQRQQQESLVIQTPHVQQVTAMSSTPPPENHHHQHHQNQVHHHNNTHHALALKKLEEEKQQLKTQLMLSEQRAAQMTLVRTASATNQTSTVELIKQLSSARISLSEHWDIAFALSPRFRSR